MLRHPRTVPRASPDSDQFSGARQRHRLTVNHHRPHHAAQRRRKNPSKQHNPENIPSNMPKRPAVGEASIPTVRVPANGALPERLGGGCRLNIHRHMTGERSGSNQGTAGRREEGTEEKCGGGEAWPVAAAGVVGKIHHRLASAAHVRSARLEGERSALVQPAKRHRHCPCDNPLGGISTKSCQQIPASTNGFRGQISVTASSHLACSAPTRDRRHVPGDPLTPGTDSGGVAGSAPAGLIITGLPNAGEAVQHAGKSETGRACRQQPSRGMPNFTCTPKTSKLNPGLHDHVGT